MAKQKAEAVKKVRVTSKGNTTVAIPSFTRDSAGKALKLALNNYPPQRSSSREQDSKAMQAYRNEYRKYMVNGYVPRTWGDALKAAGVLKEATRAMRNPKQMQGFTFTLTDF